MAAATQFNNSAGAVAGFKYSWDFGDGTSSTEANPSHSFAKGGDYEVSLKVSNEAGASREVKYKLTVNNLALVKGLVCSGEKETGWCWQQPRPTGTERYETFFLDAKTGWTAGGNGEIFKTTDASVSWQRQPSGVDVPIRTLRFIDANNGWALGDYGAVLRTTDGGTTWRVSKIDTSQSLNSIVAFDAQTVIVRDGSNAMYISVDGGQTWRTSTIMPTEISKNKVIWSMRDGVLSKSTDLGVSETKLLDVRPTNGYYGGNYELRVIDDQRLIVKRYSYGYVNNVYGYTTEFWRSQDGGATWDVPAMQGLPALTNYSSASFIYSAPSGVLLMNWNGNLYRSTDLGASWSKTGSVFDNNYYYLDTSSFISAGDKTVVYFRYGTGFISTDDGLSWTSMGSLGSGAYYSTLKSGATLDAQTLQINFSDGSSYRSADKGKTWNLFIRSGLEQDTAQLRSFWAVDAKHALGINGKNELVESKDGGLSWQVKLTGLYGSYASQIFFASTQVGWMVVGDGKVYRTTDGGETWITGLMTGFYANSLHFVDETNGWSIVNGKLMQSKNGGLSWTEVGAMPASAGQVLFHITTPCFSYPSSPPPDTRDGGKTWTPRFTGAISNIVSAAYADANNVWAISSSYASSILHSSDGGETWQSVAIPASVQPASIHFLDAKRGWIVGAAGRVLATEDGGKTWLQQSSGTSRNLLQVQFVDAKTGWLLGENGALLATGTGGK